MCHKSFKINWNHTRAPVKFASNGADAASNLLVVVLALSCWRRVCQGRFSLFRLDFPKTHFSHSHSLWRRVVQISFSESAPPRFSFLKARLSFSPFWRRACQIRLFEDAALRFILEFLWNRLTGSKLLCNHLRNHFRNRFRNRYSYTPDSVSLHSAQPAPIMEWSGQP